MNLPTRILVFVLGMLTLVSCKNQEKKPELSTTVKTDYYTEPYRPQFHFSPEEKWMNDPNGMVYHKGVYHLFYQYYPEDIVWGPMHWGHATSKDLIHWQHKPIALYPDEHGLIFSGSAVVDFGNTSGFGTLENPPLVAIYTYHDIEAEKAGKNNYETQGIAYSLDNGDTWTKYEGNPVIGNDGMKDFRDPKVFWSNATYAWVMVLAVGDHIELWNSDDLKTWVKFSEFGKDVGNHGGVWECPDLFPIKVEGSDEEKWVLLVSVGRGAPNGGSGTQYFIGDYDGETFTTDQKKIKWVDWGTDNYAGVTYSFSAQQDAERPFKNPVFLGWMSNWIYATKTPTEKWRSAMTVPRTLSLKKMGDDFSLFNYPIRNLESIVVKKDKRDITVTGGTKEIIPFDGLNQAEVRFQTSAKNFQLKLSNRLDEEVLLTMLGEEKQFFLDRTNSGKVEFQEDFASVQIMPVPNLPEGAYEVRLLLDHSSIEVFINKGQYVMTAQLFPNENYADLTAENLGGSEITLKDFQISEIKRIW